MPIEFKFDAEKVKEALAYLASKLPSGLEKYIACKLLFLADKYHLVRYGRTITGDRYFAMPHGPAPTRTLDLLNALLETPETTTLSSALKIDRSFRYPRFLAVEPPAEWENLSKSDREALDETLERYGSRDFPKLKILTHDLVAYQRAWEGRGSRNSVPMAFEDFFEDDPDAIAGVLEEAIEDSEIRRAFSGR